MPGLPKTIDKKIGDVYIPTYCEKNILFFLFREMEGLARRNLGSGAYVMELLCQIQQAAA